MAGSVPYGILQEMRQMKKVITIGREFGSGGREIGRRIAEKLQIAYYDQEIVTEIAKRTKLSEEYVERITEDRPYMAYPIHTGMSFYTAYYDYTEFERVFTVFAEQHNMIKELAERSDCVIVGRCADYILKEKDPFRIFVYADAESKLKRCRERSPEDENLSDSKIRRNIRSIDKGRARYYNYFSRQKWGARENYDLLINTSGKDVKQVSEAVADYLKRYLFDRRII
mgnify:FL=1